MANKPQPIFYRLPFLMAVAVGCMAGSPAAANEDPAGILPTIYHLDLQYTSSLPAGERYDARHVAVCLQGLANREAPRVFLTFHSTDSVWLTRLQESGGLCEGWGLQTLQDMEEYIARFSKYAAGVVLYDPDPNTGTISSSLVATTAAGAENAIAVRKDTSAGSMYNYLVNDPAGPRLPVLIDLTGKFTGSGTIWQTSTPSTGSAKCDAYIWAKEKYIDTGKCDPTVLMYTLDLWGLKVGADLRTQLSNLDYAVQKKGFCFELSPWGDEVATDDPSQPLGTDLDTFRKILNACNLQTGKSRMIKFCGFTNWDYKYTSNGSVGGSHGEVATEWETMRLLSAYNAYAEADAPSLSYISDSSFYSGLSPEIGIRNYVQNPAPTYADLQAKGYIDGSGNVADGNYILIGMGDYDQASWTLSALASGNFDDPNRGGVECSWGVDPNAIDRASVAIDYMYRHKTAKDFFMAWDSGAGYVHPTQLYGSRSPSGYSSAVGIWQDHCRKYYRMLDYSISGWLLNAGSGGSMSTTEIDNYKSFSGDGIGFHTDLSSSPSIQDNVPYQQMNHDATISYSSGVHFGWEREVLWSPTQLKQKVDASASNQHFLNAYEYYYLMRYYKGGNNDYRATWMSDTIPRIMAAGQTYSVTVTVRNDGWDAWSEGNLYRLSPAILPAGSPVATASDYDSTPPNRVLLPAGTTVNPGESVTFSFSLTAPSANGNYDVYYDMVRDGVAWFHDKHNIEGERTIIVATNETDIDTDGDGVPDVTEDQNGSLFWHPDDVVGTVILGDLQQTYDGLPKPVSATTVPPGLAVDLLYDGSTHAPSGVGSHVVVGTINDPTYHGSATNTLVIETSADYNAWKAGWFTPEQQADPAISGPDACFDGDGFSNWQEYIAGTDPTNGLLFPHFDMQPETTGAGGCFYVLNWSSVSGRVYSANWTADLQQPFTPLQTGIEWPQSSYTDQTHQAETEGFYRVNVSLKKPPPVVTSADFSVTTSAGVEGVSGDVFDGAVVSANSALHPVSSTTADWFSAPNTTELLFSDAGAGTAKFIEFNTAGQVALTNLTAWLSGDPQTGADGRSIRHVKFWAGATPGVWDETTLVADVAVNPDYNGTYGSQYVKMSMDLSSIPGRYFRIEFVQDSLGARIREIDAFSE